MAARSLVRNPFAAFSIFIAMLAAMSVGPLASCGEQGRPGLDRVVIKEKMFWLEAVTDEPTRIKGLGGRESIPEDGGMLFVFPFSDRLSFVMRDCTFDIDIAFLDDAGRVVATHTMTTDPKKPGESDSDYEARLTRYPSRYPARFAVEVQAGTLDRLGVKAGDLFVLDVEGLKKRAR